MHQYMRPLFCLLLSVTLLFAGCASHGSGQGTVANGQQISENQSDPPEMVQTDHSQADQTADPEQRTVITLNSDIVKLADGLEAVRYDGDYGFNAFLSQGGASSDGEVVEYLAANLLDNLSISGLLGDLFGCSTLAATSPAGEALFGRNFDWNRCNAMIVASYPEDGYASLSTVNTDFIAQGVGRGPVSAVIGLDSVKTLAALYAPLDGMNEAGLAVSVNMIQDSATINQNTGKPDLTTTTAVRLLLNQAADVQEALELLEQYDLHASMGMMVHFALADRGGRSVVVEYINNEMVVTETPVVTNFYLAEGEKNGIGTSQSHERYEILTNRLAQSDILSEADVRDALSSVSKRNFGEFESTEWSIVMNLDTGETRYYHRENYENSYVISLEGGPTK